jgi:hypothetical protein
MSTDEIPIEKVDKWIWTYFKAMYIYSRCYNPEDEMQVMSVKCFVQNVINLMPNKFIKNKFIAESARIVDAHLSSSRNKLNNVFESTGDFVVIREILEPSFSGSLRSWTSALLTRTPSVSFAKRGPIVSATSRAVGSWSNNFTD